MDAKELRTNIGVSARVNDGNSKYAPSGAVLQSNRNKPYQDIGSNSSGKVDVPTSRPCAIIGPDRVIPTDDAYPKKAPVEPWPSTDNVYRPDYAQKFYDYQPIRNISPRQTFQENMKRIMVPPTYSSTKNNEETNIKSKQSAPQDAKYCDVPYTVPVTEGHKSVRNSDVPVSNLNPALAGVPPHGWPSDMNARLRPFGAPDVYHYPDYSNCVGSRPLPIVRPNRTVHEDPMQMYPNRLYHDANVCFKPYPTTKERYPQQRYEYLNNFPKTFQPPTYTAHKYDLQKTIPPHPYPIYSSAPIKYMDRRIQDPILDGYQRPNPQGNFNSPYHNQIVQPPYGSVPGNNFPPKVYHHPTDGKTIATHKIAYDSNNKMYMEYGNVRNKGYPTPENIYLNDVHRSNTMKGDILYPPYASINMHPMAQHPMYRKDNMPLRNEYMPNYRNMDPSMNMNAYPRNPFPFSPSAIAISPAESNTSNDTTQTLGASQEDCGYVSQTSSVRSIESGHARIKNDIYNRYPHTSMRHSPLLSQLDFNSNSKSNKDKKGLNVRQFLQMWNEGEDEIDNNKNLVQKEPNIFPNQLESTKNQEPLYIIDLVNVPSEELSKYEHIQKISKLPENIKGYNSIELLNQYEQLVESPSTNNFNNKLASPQQYQSLKGPVVKQTSYTIPRSESPLDVEAKISQSVIHKEVGCNFEIRPCSPKMLNAEVAAPVQNILGERLIEKVVNPIIPKSPILHILDDNNVQNSLNETPIIPSCKMLNSPYTVKSPVDPVKASYNFQDLASSSGICLASLPRLDNDIELNFPEINQQFINANKIDSVITSTQMHEFPVLEMDNIETTTKTKLGEDQIKLKNETDNEFLKLSKYRKHKKTDLLSKENKMDLDTQNITFSRTDSVIIKNPENTKNHAEKIDDDMILDCTEENFPQQNHDTCIQDHINGLRDSNVDHDNSEDNECLNSALDFSLNKNLDNINTNQSDVNVSNENHPLSDNSEDYQDQNIVSSEVSSLSTNTTLEKKYNNIEFPASPKEFESVNSNHNNEHLSKNTTVSPENLKLNDNLVMLENVLQTEIPCDNLDLQYSNNFSESKLLSENPLSHIDEPIQYSEEKNMCVEESNNNRPEPVKNNYTTTREAEGLKNREVNEISSNESTNDPIQSNPISVDDNIVSKVNEELCENFQTLQKYSKESSNDLAVYSSKSPENNVSNSSTENTESKENSSIDSTNELIHNNPKSIDDIESTCVQVLATNKLNPEECTNTRDSPKSTDNNIVKTEILKNPNKYVYSAEDNECTRCQILFLGTNVTQIHKVDIIENDTKVHQTLVENQLISNKKDDTHTQCQHTPSENLRDSHCGGKKAELHASPCSPFNNTNTDLVKNVSTEVEKDNLIQCENKKNQAIEEYTNNLEVNTIEVHNGIDCGSVIQLPEHSNDAGDHESDCLIDYEKSPAKRPSEDINFNVKNMEMRCEINCKSMIHPTENIHDEKDIIDGTVAEQSISNKIVPEKKADTNLETILENSVLYNKRKCYKIKEITSQNVLDTTTDNMHCAEIYNDPNMPEDFMDYVSNNNESNNYLISNGSHKTRKELFSPWIQKLVLHNEGLCNIYYDNHQIEDESLNVELDVADSEMVDIHTKSILDVPESKDEAKHSPVQKNLNSTLPDGEEIDSSPNDKIPNQEDFNHKQNILENQQIYRDEDSRVFLQKEKILDVEDSEIHTSFSHNNLECTHSDLDDSNDGVVEHKDRNVIHENLINPYKTSLPIKQCSKLRNNLKRSFSESALDSYTSQQEENNFIKRQKNEGFVENTVITENICNLIQSSRRNSISTFYNEENVSFCILIENDCIISDGGEESEKKYYTAISEECLSAEINDNSTDNVHHELSTEEVEYEDEAVGEYPEAFVIDNLGDKTQTESWFEDVACIETVVSDDIADDIIISAPASPKDDNSSERDIDDNERAYFQDDVTEQIDKVKYIYGGQMCNDDAQLLETLYRTPQMDVNKTLINSRESHNVDEHVKLQYDNESLVRLLSEQINIGLSQTNSDQVESESDPFSLNPKIEDDKENCDVDDEILLNNIKHHKSNTEVIAQNNQVTPEYKTYKSLDESNVHDECEQYSSVFIDTTNQNEDNTTYSGSSSPEVSSTTSEEKSTSILLKITSYKGKRKSQVDKINSDSKNTISYKLTESKDYQNFNYSSKRPLITKAAQKYIPPLRETIRELKVKLPLPEQSLKKLKQLKLSKEEPKLEKTLNKLCNKSLRPEIPKKLKPKFEDVLKSIDEIQFKMQKVKNKKPKHSIPKVVIKKNQNGAHYASTSNKNSFNPDLTGRKWQPWVFLEKNIFIDKMAIKKKTKAVFNHRKNTYVFAEKFRKYKSINTKFIISQPNPDDSSKGKLKYTIRLKH